MKIGIYTNLKKDLYLSHTQQFIELLLRKGIPFAVHADIADKLPDFESFCFDMQGITHLTVFGGDGTILGISKDAAVKGVPMLGINLGSLGFLTEVEDDGLEACIDALMLGRYQTEERAVLEAKAGGKAYLALNEVLLMRENKICSPNSAITLEAYSGEQLIDRFVADGVIVSTPTGSTAYSLSCGGPVLSPALSALVITAVCPHSMHSRPIVLPDDGIIRVKAVSEGAKTVLSVDGDTPAEFEGGSTEVTVTRSGYSAKFIRFTDVNFYKKLISKFNKWGTTI